MFTLSLVISIPFCRNRDERAGEYGSVPSNNQQSWQCGCLHRRFSRAATIESNERGLSTSVESKRSPIDRDETRCRSTQIDQCKCAFSTSVESKRSPIDDVETRFQFSLLVVRLSHAIDQCKCALSDGYAVVGWNALLDWRSWFAVETGIPLRSFVTPFSFPPVCVTHMPRRISYRVRRIV
jgi:hypothetical protein